MVPQWCYNGVTTVFQWYQVSEDVDDGETRDRTCEEKIRMIFSMFIDTLRSLNMFVN
jgi:hypothetical protein